MVFAVFVAAAWFWVVFTLVSDLLRDHELSGWWKAVWLLFLILVPFLTGLVYLIARGNGMDERAMKARIDARGHGDRRLRDGPRGATAEELDTLQGLRERGALTDVEFEAAKSRRFA